MQDIDPLGLEGGLKLSGSLTRSDHLSQYWDNLLGLNSWGRASTLNADNTVQGRVDNDIFSLYGHEHRYGIEVTDTISYRPWIDSRFGLNLGIKSNENLNLFKPERTQLLGRWDQLLGSARLSLRYRWQHYYRDSDRDDSFNRYGPDLRLGWDLWPRSEGRMELYLRMGLEQSQSELSGYIGIRWHQRDRHYRDFSSAEVPFKLLRRLAWPTPDDET